MASDQFILKEDGFLNIGTQSSSITYHSSLNVILVFNRENEVKVLDVHSSVILKSCKLSECKNRVRGRYLPLQEKILFWDDRNLGLRGDYNGVLLLDTILQTPVPQNDDIVRLEMLLSEAILFQQSLQSLEDHGVEFSSDVMNELLEKIREAQGNVKKSIKAQRWNTVCIELPYSSLKLVANNVVFNLKQLERHIPALAIASAINERLTDLLMGSRVVDTVNPSTFERCLMYSEHARRQTFEKWPHMDYKWALPDQMAQAGFYHQPSSTGEDRAMCFTCNVCLVCWEKTDEPWSEHERHSPNCPFVKGEYTQNVPLSVTYATCPAFQTDGFNVISNTDHSHVLCTSNGGDELTVWSVERQLRKMHSFHIQNCIKEALNGDENVSTVQITAIGILPVGSESQQNPFANKISAISPKGNILGSKFVVGVTVNRLSGTPQLYVSTFVIEDAFNPKAPSLSDEPTKTGIIEKTELEKDPSLVKFVSDDCFDENMLKFKLAQVCSFTMNEDEKSFYLDFDDNSSHLGMSCKIIEDSEKILKDSDTTKVESLDSAKVQKVVDESKMDEINCRLISCVNIVAPSEFSGFTIADIVSVSDGKQIMVKLQRKDSVLIEDIEDETLKMDVDEDTTTIPANFTVNSQLQIFDISEYGAVAENPRSMRAFDKDKTAREICVIPKLDNNTVAVSTVIVDNRESSVVCLVCMDGTLELVQLNSLTTIANVSLTTEKVVSATFCKSLERLCGCTENGSLIFYALRDSDPDSTDEMMDDDNPLLITSDTSLTGCEQDVSEIDGGATASPKNVCLKKQADLQQANLSTTSNLAAGGAGESAHSSPTPNLLAYKNEFTTSDLQSLYSLTQFDEMLTPFVAEVPGCWNELVQAQKQRRHPQNLRPGEDTHLTKTWRLHNDATTWDEHIIELTLVKPSCLGHIDLKFSLYQQCPNPPAIQVTLLKQNTSGFGYRMKSHHTINVTNDTAVDENIEFNLADNEGTNENPVLTEEYLQAHNAEILAGPIELSSCMDLCDQGGLVTLTSPKLFKTRARNFLLHIKTMVDPSKDGQGKTRVPVRKKGVMRFLFSSFANNSSQNSTNATYSQNSSNKQSRNDYYIGCDWLHEISITVRSTKSDNKIINDRMQRFAMLESNGFLENLLKIACDTTKLHQNISMDILIWLCTIRLTRFRSPKLMDRGGGGNSGAGTSKQNKGNETPQKTASGSACFSDNSTMDMATQQKECVLLVEQYLKKIIMACIINGDRTLAHKAVKLILVVSEGVRNLPNDIHQKYSFEASLRIAIVSCLPFIATAGYSSAVRWFTFLISATSSPESHVAISESSVKLLMSITGEINKRWNLFDSLLGSRYGLNGFPFEPDIFDIELPPLTRSNSTPNTLANIIKSNAGLMQPYGLDIKKLSSIDGVELRSFPHLIKRKGISNQVRGLLEVEPLHFTCLTASEATRIENMDSLTSSTASNINMEEIVTSTPLYNNVEGFFDAKKDTDKDNMNDDMMNNVKNILVDKFVNSALKKYKLKDDLVTIKSNGVVEAPDSYPIADKTKKINPKISAQYQDHEEYNQAEEMSAEKKLANRMKKYMTDGGNNEDYTNIFSWHKLLSVPPKQMVVVDRIHSGARRYVVIDFGSPILLTDLVIPACDELASMLIDIWCLDEDESTRLVTTQDIGVKTLVLSDLQPPPICRYMKITIIGRYGMSATRCKIPIGYFYGHVVILENYAYSDPLLNYVKANPANISGQVKALKSLYDDVQCRYSLSSSKLIELLTPILNSELCNVAHMHAYINKLKDDDNQIDNAKIISTYDECINLQHQLNVVRSVIDRLENSLDPSKTQIRSQNLASASRDKLRTLSESLVEILLHFTIEYGAKNILSMHSFFNIDVANTLFNTLVVSGDSHIQLATCSLLVRMCCFQSWWGDFLANIFCTLYSSQNTRLFPQDRVFFLLSYLGRKSITMGACRSIVIDAILKTLAKQLAPISPRYNRNENSRDGETSQSAAGSALWSKSDLQLITWLLLFLSVCLDGNPEKKDKSASRWEFMSCETDISKSRPQSSSSSGKTLPRCFKKRIIQQNKYNGISSYSDWNKKMSIFQSEFPEIFMELTGKSKPKINKHNAPPKPPKEASVEPENSFDQGLKSTKIANLLIVIRGLIGLILEMDFTCNMDLFLLTCKVIARLVSACKPSIQLSKVITSNQLEQLIRLAVWNDQQQPWAVHTITCLLQDLLDADKNFKVSFEIDPNEGTITLPAFDDEDIDDPPPTILEPSEDFMHSTQVVKEISYADTVKYGQLPSLIECEDAELDEFLHEFDIVGRGRSSIKKDNIMQNKNSFNFFCKSVSSSLDSRLDYGLDTNVEILIRRLTMTPSLDLYDSLPQISTSEMDFSSSELVAWPEGITTAWTGQEYNSGQRACEVFKNVFDNIFADLHLQDTWVHLEQLLQMWLTLNSELSERPGVRKIAFGTNAVEGLLSALAWHSDIKLRTWGLGFHCLTLACHLKPECDGDNSNYNHRKVDVAIIKDENFEKMLLRFFSGYGMSSSTTTNRCAGPTICKYLHELLGVLSVNASFADSTTNVKRKLKDTLLNVVLQLVQPGGAISNQQGPIDAQSQLVRHLMSIHYDKADLNVAMSIIESVSYLVYNNISNSEKILCQRSSDSGNSTNTFGSLFATVLGSDNSKQNTTVSDSSLIVSLLKLSTSLVQAEIESRSENASLDMSTGSQTDEIKAEQQNNIPNQTKVPCVADTVLRHFPTMKRLLGALSHCSSSSFSLFVSSSLYQINITEISSSFNEPQTTADAVFNLLMLLCTKASQTNLVIAPIYQYLESNSSPRNILPRLQLSEPFLWYVLRVLETPAAVQVFSEMGGMKILCQNLIKCNKVLMNMQPGLISLIMQHLTKSSKIKCISNSNVSSTSAKKTTQNNMKSNEGAINFAPFCTISSENSAAQPADVLIQTPIASHRRARTPAWSYMFYPNESYVDLTLTLPTAIMLMEIQIQPHLSSLASCPSAVAVEISRDCGLGPIPFGQAHTTVGMTFIRLKLSKPEIASSIVLRLYRPKDSSSIGLTQISVLGTTIFSGGKCLGGNNEMSPMEDDSLAKTGVGWIRILARCFSVAMFPPENPLANAVVTATAEYPGFLEACCTLLNIMPLCSNIALQNLETVLLKLGTHDRTLSLSLVHNLLSGTMPQVYRLCNEAVCDLLYDLCTKNDAFATDRIYVLLEWIVKVYEHFDAKSLQHINPHSGLLKVISSILWTVHTTRSVSNLTDLITDDLFEVCFRMVENCDINAAVKTAFDSLMCSFCYIRPELFAKLLNNCGFVEHMQTECMTDDTKEANSSSGPTTQHPHADGGSLTKLLDHISLLNTVSTACQSRHAVQLLIESKLPHRLAQTVHEFCCSLSPEVRKISSNTRKISNCSLTDSDKAENVKIDEMASNSVMKVYQLAEVLDFFSDCCAAGEMRDWLGSYQGSRFWKPLLELLCNHRPADSGVEPLQQHFIRIERSTINFFSRVTACHPKNQENLTVILISVIKKPQKLAVPLSNAIISGFTRRLVLQLLLESEKILISVRSKMTLHKRNNSMYSINNHPSKRTNAHHLLFYLSSHTKCQDLLQNCISIYSNIIPSMSADTKPPDVASSSSAAKNQNDNHKELLDMDFRLVPHGMEFLSVVAGVTAKDKRLKDVKNQAVTLKEKELLVYPKYYKLASDDLFANNGLKNQSPNSASNCLHFQHSACPELALTSDINISQILALIQARGHSLSTPCLELELASVPNQSDELTDEGLIEASDMEPLATPLQRFSSRGGLSLLAHYLPTVFPENSKANAGPQDKEKSPPSNEWVKVEPNDEIYEDLEDSTAEAASKMPTITSVPQHSLAAFGLFLRLPAYSDVLLRDKLRAQCLLRLVLGVTGDGEGNDIYSLSLAPSLPTLPFEVFRQLLDTSPLTTDDGVLLRRMVIEVGAMHLVLNCLGIFTHQSQNYQISGPAEVTNGVKNPATDPDQMISDDKSHMYWAKGTGFGTGSTQQSWDVEQALLRQKSEEEHVTVLLQVLSSYINPGDKVPKYLSCDDVMGDYHDIAEVSGELPAIFLDLLQKSCLIPALSSYLRNDSVLDITRHIPLYRSILQLLRALALCNQLMGLLQPKDPGVESTSIAALLINMKTCVDTYAKRLKVNKKSNIKGQTQKVTVNLDDGDDEGLALLIPDIQETTLLVQRASNIDSQSGSSHDSHDKGYVDRPISSSIEQRYLEIMKKLQFDTYEMIVECESGYRFVVSHHFENNVRTAGDRGHPSRVKRLAQETVTLSTSLPLSYSSSVFVRCDTDRLDIMKVLITGPADTPYANGCFEFDVYFPPDYPNSPMLINLETTGRHTVRFNPNLYNDGKVCLSVLNTWHGRPEEKWNAQTSSFLQVLVSIQSLILVPEPYFNEPGFERSRGTPSGTHCSREYNSNIYQACVRWAMLEQIRNPSPCFKEVIHTHFWLKRNEVCAQIEGWINELNKPQYTERSGRAISFNSMVLRRQYKQLREELARLPVPEGLEDLDSPFNPTATSLLAMPEAMVQQSHITTPQPIITQQQQQQTITEATTSKVETDSEIAATTSGTMSASTTSEVSLLTAEDAVKILDDDSNDTSMFSWGLHSQ